MSVLHDSSVRKEAAPEEVMCRHGLRPYFAELAACGSTPALHASPLFQRLRPQLDQLLLTKEYVECARPSPQAVQPFYRIVAWNIERGAHYDGIYHFLTTHPQLRHADLLLLTETDLGMARSGNRHVARDLAEALGMHYYFVPSYLNLCKGNGAEHEADGENTLALHGNAILSHYPLHDLDVVVLPNGKDKMRGKEKRVGSQKALVATVRFPGRSVRVACVHLDAHSTQAHRAHQMRLVLDALDKWLPATDDRRPATPLPVLIGGDWNTSTYNSSRAFTAICGFWYRVAMGVSHVMRNHYPHPYRRFERELFEMLRRRGFDFERCNEPGVCTNHYDAADFRQNKSLRDWVPQWCFHFIEWALRPYNGRCSFKIDWFATRGMVVASPNLGARSDGAQAIGAKVVGDLRINGRPVSDHDAILLDISASGRGE